jgi:hypothetical protein
MKPIFPLFIYEVLLYQLKLLQHRLYFIILALFIFGRQTTKVILPRNRYQNRYDVTYGGIVNEFIHFNQDLLQSFVVAVVYLCLGGGLYFVLFLLRI